MKEESTVSIKLEKVVETFYLNLEKGKITGRKCAKCGAVEFPPVYACNSCGCWDMEWVEISGKASMHSIVLPAALSSKPEYKDLGKYAYGEVELEEGARYLWKNCPFPAMPPSVSGMATKPWCSIWRKKNNP